jgi:hypothetical protein
MIYMQTILATKRYLPKWNPVCLLEGTHESHTYARMKYRPTIIAKVQEEEVDKAHNLF